MTAQPVRIPREVPVGTKFVIEGRRSGEGRVRVSRRYLEFPDGTCVRLPNKPAIRSLHRRKPASRRSPVV